MQMMNSVRNRRLDSCGGGMSRSIKLSYIGKESNHLEEVESGTVHAEEDVYLEYADPRRDEWNTKIVPALKNKLTLSVLEKKSGLSRRMLIDARTGKRRPHLDNQKLLISVLRNLGSI
jgi:hypothetical protein